MVSHELDDFKSKITSQIEHQSTLPVWKAVVSSPLSETHKRSFHFGALTLYTGCPNVGDAILITNSYTKDCDMFKVISWNLVVICTLSVCLI